MDFVTTPRGELITLIYEQQRQIDLLKEIIIDLQEKQKQKESGDDSSKQVPGFVKANVNKKKAKKRKMRTQGFSRQRETPTKMVFHSFDLCPACGVDDLGQPAVSYSRQIIDIPTVTYEVVEHAVFKRYCFACERTITPRIDFSASVLGKGRIGINLMAAIFTMREEEDMPLHKIQDHLHTFYGLELSLGEIMEILHRQAELGKKPVEEIKQQLLLSKVIYADETGGRENGINRYSWSFSNQQFQLLLYGQRRSAKIVEAVFGTEGKNYTGVLVTDFYTAYNEYFGPHQRCWVHYLRDLKKLKEENPKDRKLKRWIKQIHAVYAEARAYPGPDPGLQIGLKEQERITKEAYFKQKLKKLCAPYIKSETPQAKLAARALRFLSELFTFIRFEGVNSDNNLAERAVRKTVIKRKISFGTRSKKGSETRSILGSLFGTWRLQHLNPFKQMRLLLLNASYQ